MNVPHPYDKDDLLADAYKRGWNHGHGIACHNVPTIGKRYHIDGMGTYGYVNRDNIREVHQSNTFTAAEHSRDFSPFEFTAHEFNQSEYAEGLWEAFDEGETAAINADLATYTDEDYGVIQEEVGDDY